jgi:hypothetical protein
VIAEPEYDDLDDDLEDDDLTEDEEAYLAELLDEIEAEESREDD